MTLWHLELLRLWRTRRAIALLSVFVLFGLLGPVAAHYLPEIVANVGGDLRIIAPQARPVDGIAQYTRNAIQVGAVVAVVIAAAALCVDTKPSLAIFYRTRVATYRDLVLPRLAVTIAATIAAFAIGTLAAWYETSVLIGPLPAGRLALGSALTAIYLIFVVALTAATAALGPTQVSAIALALALLLGMPILGLLPWLDGWVPSRLAGAIPGVVNGDSLGSYTGSVGITVLAAMLATICAIVRGSRREL
jgi:ABC-2 type transport system permease protein